MCVALHPDGVRHGRRPVGPRAAPGRARADQVPSGGAGTGTKDATAARPTRRVEPVPAPMDVISAATRVPRRPLESPRTSTRVTRRRLESSGHRRESSRAPTTVASAPTRVIPGIDSSRPWHRLQSSLAPTPVVPAPTPVVPAPTPVASGPTGAIPGIDPGHPWHRLQSSWHRPESSLASTPVVLASTPVIPGTDLSHPGLRCCCTPT